MLRSERQALQAGYPAPCVSAHGECSGKTSPPQPPKGRSKQGENAEDGAKLREGVHKFYTSSRNSVIRTPSKFSMTTISAEPLRTPPM